MMIDIPELFIHRMTSPFVDKERIFDSISSWIQLVSATHALG
jgi:hypothetical protein